MNKPNRPTSQQFKTTRSTVVKKPLLASLSVTGLAHSLLGAAVFGFLFGCAGTIAVLSFFGGDSVAPPVPAPVTGFPNSAPLDKLPQKQPPLRIYDSPSQRQTRQAEEPEATQEQEVPDQTAGDATTNGVEQTETLPRQSEERTQISEPTEVPTAPALPNSHSQEQAPPPAPAPAPTPNNATDQVPDTAEPQ